ncbi:MAG: hypothetical protein ACRD4Q_06205 [Candidatus Acidiferrales bacterium]
MSITKTHSGNFTQEQQGATYALTVSNTSGAGATSGLVTVTDTIPSGLTLASMAGTGWTCTTSTCMRSDALNGGSSYPAITVTVNVASNASSPQVNQVSVTGGGSSQANATDSTTITAAGSGAGVYYYLQDQIGSTRVIAEIPQGQNTATLCYHADFHPYGGELPVVDNCPADFEFVGKERDPESNLDNSQARSTRIRGDGSCHPILETPEPILAIRRAGTCTAMC